MVRIIRREIRERSGWGKLWRFVFFATLVLSVFQIGSLAVRIGEVQQKATGLGKLAVSAYGQNRLIEAAFMYGAVVVLAGLMAYWTRGRKVIIEDRVEDPPSRSQAKPPMR